MILSLPQQRSPSITESDIKHRTGFTYFVLRGRPGLEHQEVPWGERQPVKRCMQRQAGITLQQSNRKQDWSSVGIAGWGCNCACAGMGKDECKILALFSALTSTINLSQSWQIDNVDTGVPGNSAALFFSEQCLFFLLFYQCTVPIKCSKPLYLRSDREPLI